MSLAWVVLSVLVTGCGPRPGPRVYQLPDERVVREPGGLGTLDERRIDFKYDGGQLELELYRRGSRLTQVVRNRYAVPVMVRWTVSVLDNVQPVGAAEGVALVPAAPTPLGLGTTIVLAELEQLDPAAPYSRELAINGKFGDPRATPAPYAYRLPYPIGLTFAVLQGFHGGFSHRGSNEYAIDFDCPVATPVLAAREGMVVASNAAAQGAGTTPEFLDYRRTNFVIVAHDDGTLGEYMHLAPSSIEVRAGQHVERGQRLALSGYTGFSSTPHLHFQVMTAAEDGSASRSFPFTLAVAPDRVEEPVQARRYSAWE
ncbi:MAG: M23 family metallopeptidase [Deltaproteobacteria bacterium]|nr:M23 family metallopeptidase [Deltaproteobacteria bacterium]